MESAQPYEVLIQRLEDLKRVVDLDLAVAQSAKSTDLSEQRARRRRYLEAVCMLICIGSIAFNDDRKMNGPR